MQAPINTIFLIAPIVVFGLAWIATWGVEKRYSRLRDGGVIRSKDSPDEGMGFKSALTILTNNRQTGIFFLFLIMITLGLFMQEAVLEPYGGEVLICTQLLPNQKML